MAERTLSELRQEIQARADRQGYPLNGLPADDVRRALKALRSVEPDHWAQAWMSFGDEYRSKAAEMAANGHPAAARSAFMQAYEFYNFGRWPVPSSPLKKESSKLAIETFLDFAALADPPIELVTIPFESRTISAYLRRPKIDKPVPAVIDIGGVDHWKEKILIESTLFLDVDIAILAIDMPGTGDAPLPVLAGSESMYSAVIDYLVERQDIDASKIFIRGQSWGSHWALRTAIREASRLRGAVFQSGPVHHYFQRAWFESSLDNREYLMDFVPSRLHVLNQKTVEDAIAFLPKLSLLDPGILDDPTPAMLLIGGPNDRQTPFADIELLMHHGSPKNVWVNPTGGHMGRSATIGDRDIFSKVTVPWIVRQAQDSAGWY